MSNTKTTSLVECLRPSFATHGLPFVIVTNNRPSFTSNKFKTFIQKNKIKHIFTACYHPSSIGMAKWSIQTYKSAIKKIIEGKNVMELNTSISQATQPQSITGKSPAEMLFNCRLTHDSTFWNSKWINKIWIMNNKLQSSIHQKHCEHFILKI